MCPERYFIFASPSHTHTHPPGAPAFRYDFSIKVFIIILEKEASKSFVGNYFYIRLGHDLGGMGKSLMLKNEKFPRTPSALFISHWLAPIHSSSAFRWRIGGSQFYFPQIILSSTKFILQLGYGAFVTRKKFNIFIQMDPATRHDIVELIPRRKKTSNLSMLLQWNAANAHTTFPSRPQTQLVSYPRNAFSQCFGRRKNVSFNMRVIKLL